MQRACFAVTLPRWKPAYHTKAVSGRMLCLSSQSQVAASSAPCDGAAAVRPSQRRDAAIVVLAQNSAHSTYGRNSRQTLERCLQHLYAFYSHVDAADVLIFHNGDFAPADQEQVRAQRRRLFFELLTAEYWRTPPEYFEHEKTFKATRFALGYRHMIRWWARMCFQKAHELGYDWIMRLDDDSLLHSPVRYNLFEFMATRGLGYGYRLASCEPIKHASFYRVVQRYVLQRGLGIGWLGAHCARSEAEQYGVPSCGHSVWGVYNNFFIANVSLWMRTDVQDFLDYIDRLGVIYLYNWNDILWHTAVIKLFLRRSATYRFSDFTYEHATFAGPPGRQRVAWGLIQAGTGDSEGSARVAAWAAKYRARLATNSSAQGPLPHAGHDGCGVQARARRRRRGVGRLDAE